MYGIEVLETSGINKRVEMWGEFDLSTVEDLQASLNGLVSLRRPVIVDLSRVTFLDLQVVMELAVYSRLYGHHLTFRAPSWQARRSIEVCGLEGWIQADPQPPVFSAVS